MPYKPKYCCQCGEKIDRVEWKFWMSWRFCELCETDYKIHEWTPRVLFVIALLLGLFGIGTYFQKPNKQLAIASSPIVESNIKSDLKQTKAAPQVSADDSVLSSVKAPFASVPTASKPLPSAAPTISAEKVYFCGAPTKKGTLCSRRVKNGGRCWQHEGQTALLPQEKLIAAQ